MRGFLKKEIVYYCIMKIKYNITSISTYKVQNNKISKSHGKNGHPTNYIEKCRVQILNCGFGWDIGGR